MAAKNLLSSNRLIPAVVYEYSDDVAKGYTIKTEPAVGSSVEKDSVVTIYISKGPQLRVPDVANVDEETAKKVLTSNQLIPTITYEYSDTIIVGNVTRTEPEIGSVVEPNSKITVYLSYGPSRVEASNVITDLDIGCWMGACTVYRQVDTLYIDCSDFYYNYGSTMELYGKWYDPNNSGKISGIASLTDNYYQSIAISGKYTDSDFFGYNRHNFTIEVPLVELNVDKPTRVYILIDILDCHNHPDKIEFIITISW
ncbi:MAG: PASTA domain-containing protein [Clostridia bacterium]|nr:PASTA domain-containing protein [Clostridia bacterium]